MILSLYAIASSLYFSSIAKFPDTAADKRELDCIEIWSIVDDVLFQLRLMLYTRSSALIRKCPRRACPPAAPVVFRSFHIPPAYLYVPLCSLR